MRAESLTSIHHTSLPEREAVSPPLLTVSEVAKWLNVSDSCVYSLAEKRLLIGYKIGTGRGTWRFEEAHVAAFLAGCLTAAEVQSPRPGIKNATPFQHLDGERLRAAWRRQGVPDGAQDARSAPPSESRCVQVTLPSS